MNLVKYIFSKEYRDKCSKELVERYNIEVDEIERIYAVIEFEKKCKIA